MSRTAARAGRAGPITSGLPAGRPPRGARPGRLAAFGVAAGLHLALFAVAGLSLGRIAPPPAIEEQALLLDLTPTRQPIPSLDRPKPEPERPRPDEPPPVQPRETSAPVEADGVSPSTPPRPAVQAPAPAEPASVPSERPAPAPAQPAQGAPDTRASFHAEVLARIERARRYPPAARARREEGTAQVAFTLSRDGRVLSAAVERSSGSSVLDREALATVRRAALPDVPAELPAPLKLSVAVEFFVD